MSTNLFLANWSDITEIENQNYIDYEALLASDDEFLALCSLDYDLSFDDDEY
jgi:hypothetical protein